MTEPEHRVCREYLGKDRGDCGKPATHSVTLLDGMVLYKCARHTRRFTQDRHGKPYSGFHGAVVREIT
jgi:hypothetical protein